jgi:cation transport regulator ChaB
MAEMPPALRRALPAEARRVYQQTFEDARDEGVPEEEARMVAQEAVEESFRKVGPRWEPRSVQASSGPPYGEAAIAQLARKVRFPCTSGQFARQAGEPVVELAAGQPMPLAEMLEEVDGYYWREPKELLEALHAAWPKVKRRWGAQQPLHEAPARKA